MSRVRSQLVGLAGRVPAGRVALNRARTQRAGRRLRGAELFDADWYQQQTGTTFDSTQEALAHYLARGRRAGLTPSILFVPSWYDRKGWRRRPLDPLLHYLSRPKERARRAPSALFDPIGYLAAHPEAARHPGGPPGHWASHAGPDTPLPSAPQILGPSTRPVTWARLQEAGRATVAKWREQEALRTARRIEDGFDREAEAAFRRRTAQLPAPAAPGDTPAVSIVLPVWNRSAQVRRAVASVQAQTLADWELIVVDDGSTDDTPFVLEGLAAFDPRIVVRREPRSGVSAARNTGIAAARAPYVAFLDSDNTWQSDFLELALRAAAGRGLDAAFAAIEIRRGDRVRYRAFQGTREHLLVANHIDLNVLVVRTEVLREIGGFSTDLRRTVDYDLVLKISERHELTLLPFIGAVYTDEESDADRISVREPLSWDYVVRSRHTVDWAAADAATRVPGRTSVVLPVGDNGHDTVRCLAALLTDPLGAGAGPQDPPADLEVVVVDRGTTLANGLSLAALALADPRVRVVRTVTDVGTALAVDTVLPTLTGEHVVVMDTDCIPRPGWLAPLLRALADPGVAAAQPLLVHLDSTVLGAGATFTAEGGLPSPLLDGYPESDALALGEVAEVPALHGAAWAVRTADLVAVRGPDALFVRDWLETDLSLRLRERGRSVLVTGSVLDQVSPAGERRPTTDDAVFRSRWRGKVPVAGLQLWERAGFAVVHHRVVRDEELGTRRLLPVVVRAPRTVPDGPMAGAPSLRWAIKTAVPAGPKGRGWGDWHFAQSLAVALRRLGQDVVVDTRESTHRSSAYLDDVNLVLRGLDRVDPEEGRTNLMWVISHPDAVVEAELDGYDAVFAASTSWAASAGGAWGRPVRPLLQCTDASRFTPSAAEPDSGAPVLFVGNSRGVYRPSVRAAMEAGADLHVYGGGWEQFLPAAVVRAPSLANEQVAAAYAGAGVVLNDHWDDMRHEGFISNRVFDVVATGGRLVSDEVAGLKELFGDVVRTWLSPEELQEVLTRPVQETFPGRAERLAAAETVAREHSFDARARQLLEAVLEHRD